MKLIRIWQLSIIIPFLIAAGNTKAQDNKLNYSLFDCLNYAKLNNTEIKKAAIEEKKSREKINEVIGSGLPQINLNGSLVNNLELPTQLLPGEFFGSPGSFLKVKFGTKYNHAFTGDISQLIFNGSFWVGLSAAKQSAEYYRQNSTQVLEDVQYKVAYLYYHSLVVQKQIELLKQNHKLVGKSLNDVKLQLENGKAKQVDVDRLKVNLNNIEYQIKKGEEALKQTHNQLKVSMGMPINNEIMVTDNAYFNYDSLLIKDVVDYEYESKVSISYENRIDYKLLQTNLKLLNLDKKNQIASFLPTISAFGSYTYNANRKEFDLFDPDKDWFKYYSVGLKIQMPIFTGGQRLSRINQATLNIEGLKETIKQVENVIDMQISNETNKYQNACSNIKNNKLNTELAKKVYESTLLEYNEGVSSAMAIVDSETRLREAQTNYINSLLEYYITKIDLEKAKGTLLIYLNNLENSNQWN